PEDPAGTDRMALRELARAGSEARARERVGPRRRALADRQRRQIDHDLTGADRRRGGHTAAHEHRAGMQLDRAADLLARRRGRRVQLVETRHAWDPAPQVDLAQVVAERLD